MLRFLTFSLLFVPDVVIHAFEIPHAFDYYNEKCGNQCSSSSTFSTGILGLTNPCPQCTDTYRLEHCNKCCLHGASSLQLRFHGHGCGSRSSVLTLPRLVDRPLHATSCNITLPAIRERTPGSSKGESNFYPKVSDKDSNANGVAFLPCDCYHAYLMTGELQHGCKISHQLESTANMTRGGGHNDDGEGTNRNEDDNNIRRSVDSLDICIVSIRELEGSNNDGSTKIDLTKALPNPLLLEHFIGMPNEDTNDGHGRHNDHNDQHEPIITMFDTSCDTDRHSHHIHGHIHSHLGSLPVFPGYGKFSSTCPAVGFIDMPPLGDQNLHLHLPSSIDHWNGSRSDFRIPAQAFYYEFLDGTSSGFWPKNSEGNTNEDVNDRGHSIASLFFNPTFAMCKCNDCPSEIPSDSPSTSPSSETTTQPTGSNSFEHPSTAPTLSIQCAPEDYEDCNKFATTTCRRNKHFGDFVYQEEEDNDNICEFRFSHDNHEDVRRRLEVQVIQDAVEAHGNMNGSKGTSASADINSLLDHSYDALRSTFQIGETVSLKEWAKEKIAYHLRQIEKLQ